MTKAQKDDSDTVVVTEEVKKKVNGKEKVVKEQRYFKPLPAITYPADMPLEDCIDLELSKGAILLSKNSRANWALLESDTRRLFIATTPIDDGCTSS